MKAEDFLLEETEEEKRIKVLRAGMDAVRAACNRFLKMAIDTYRRVKEADPSPTLVGKAIAYVTCFRVLSKAAGIDTRLHDKGIEAFLGKLGEAALKIEEERHKIVIEHKKDPEGLVIEKEKLVIRKAEEDRREEEIKIRETPPPPPTPQAVSAHRMIEDVACALRSLGHKRDEAQRLATQVYRDGVEIGELVVEACRLSN